MGGLALAFLLLTFVTGKHADNGKGLLVDGDDFAQRNDFVAQLFG